MCANDDLRTILDLGRLPLANALLTGEQLQEPERRYPLVLVFCTECALVQITEALPPEVLFRHYLYFSSYSDTMLRESRRIVRAAKDVLIVEHRLGLIMANAGIDQSNVADPASGEFALLLPETGREAAHSVARRISTSIAEDSNGPRISVSVGVGVYPLDGDNVEALVSAADTAMYLMKRQRKAENALR